jgi:hypothetical protein
MIWNGMVDRMKTLHQQVGRALLLLLLLGACAFTALGQTSLGSLSGQVRDSSGAFVPMAKVKVTNEATGTSIQVESSSGGVYTANALEPGLYTVQVEAAGFEVAVAHKVEIFTARTSSQDFSLKTGSVKETVVVSEQQPLLSSNSSQMSTTVEQDTVQDIPVPERSVLGLVLLSPGVTGDPQYPTGVQSENADTQTAPIAPGSSLTVGGARLGSSSILVDGADNTLNGQPRTGVTFSKDVLQEMTIQMNGLPAQYGRTGGGIMNQSTRGGGNSFHGVLDWRHVDPSTEATTYGVPYPRELHQNMFTASLSGPVILPHYNGRNRSFFFASYEPLRGSNVIYQRTRVLTPQELSGNLANSPDLNGGHIYYQFKLNSQNIPYGAKLNSASYVQIPNDNVSAQLANNPTAQMLLAYYPTLTSSTKYGSFIHSNASVDADGNNYIQDRGVTNQDDRFTARLDQVLSRRDELNLRYTRVPISGVRYNLFGPDSPANTVPTDTITTHNAMLTETHSFSGSVINSFHITYTLASEFKGPPAASLTKDFGAAAGFYPAALGAGFPSITGLPGTGLGSGGAINTGGGYTTDTNLGYADSLSYVVGRHSLQFGFDIRFLQLNRADTSNLNGGTYTFSSDDTNTSTKVGSVTVSTGGSAIASFLLGIIHSYSLKSELETFRYRWHYYAGYVQDDWRIAPKVTLNLGLRYNVETPRTETSNRQGSFVASVPVVNSGPNPTGAFVFSGSSGLSRHLWPINYAGIEPRIGIAYAPTSSMTVRGSFGLLHSPLTGLGTNIIPDLSAPNQNTSSGAGGQNPAYWTNYLTNNVALVQPPIQGNSGVLFSYPNGALDYVNQNKMVPYSEVWGLSVQKSLGSGAIFEISYSVQHNVHLFSVPIAQNIPSLATIYGLISSHTDLSGTGITNSYGVTGLSAIQTYNPYQQFAGNLINSAYDRRGSQIYDGLFLQYVQRMRGGLRLQSAFTWSKSLDNTSSGATDLSNTTNVFGYAQVQNPYNLDADRSYSMNDIPFKFTNALTFQSPIKQTHHAGLEGHIHDLLLANWSTSSILTVQDGYPYAINLGNNGYFYSTAPSGATGDALQGAQLRPSRIPGVSVKRSNYRKDPFGINANGGYLNPAAFYEPGSIDNPQFGNVPRTMGDVRNPVSLFLDASVTKQYQIKGMQVLQLRAQAQNALNHVNFFLAGRTLQTTSYTTAANFGTMGQTDQTPGRAVQLEARYVF